MAQTSIKDDRRIVAEQAPDEPGRGERGRDQSRPEVDGRQKAADKQPPKGSVLRRHPIAVALVTIMVIAAAVGGVLWWLNARNFETTDDAFIDTRTVSISSQLTGAIVNVPVTDNQLVAAGALLVGIDPHDFQTSLAQAQAQLEQAKASLANMDAQIKAQQARIEQAQKQVAQNRAALTFAQQENDRFQDLLRRNAGTPQQAQQAASNYRQAQANLGSAEANAAAAQAQIPVLETQREGVAAQVAQMEAGLAQAKTVLGRTRLVAPEEGRATKISAAVGATAQPGQILMIFVPERKWVTANFKETQLTLMRSGQPVDIAIDAYPGRVFRGHIDSIQAGSGAAFSLLPPENATGNFVKVVQRVPVKIAFDNPPEVYIGPGMSVIPRVKVR
jgi:membrane fusion protein (multidrug efflux system)